MMLPKKPATLMQLNGETGAPEVEVKGRERIFSRPDTQELVEMATTATTDADLIQLAHYYRKSVKKQDSTPVETTEQ